MQARVLFAGTPAFALACLRALVAAEVWPAAVYTQPDRPSGRGRRLTSSPVKDFALKSGLPVRQPASLSDPVAVRELADFAPDLLIVAAYGLLLPQAVLDIPRHGCLNVHASLLPRWRGAAPIQAAIASGDRETGVSLMRMEAGLDSGPVYARQSLPIGDEETAGELHDRLAVLGGQLLVRSLPDIIAGRLRAEPQDERRVTVAGKLRPADAILDWRRPAAALARNVRAWNPVPGARFDLGDETIKCWRAQPLPSAAGRPGTVLQAGPAGVDVACGEDALRLLDVQRPGRKRISGGEFAAQVELAGQTLAVAAD
ncbi:MAG: methionyl-tRNA formyltransferase [Woeseiaceae bacterium]|nr:methionyl-tRNA formyltransferase [Woeseiaceae bacterium]